MAVFLGPGRIILGARDPRQLPLLGGLTKVRCWIYINIIFDLPTTFPNSH